MFDILYVFNTARNIAKKQRQESDVLFLNSLSLL